MNLVQERTLAQLWGISMRYVRQLGQENGWACHYVRASRHYFVDEIDTFLERHSLNFGRSPTIARLRQKEVVLVKNGTAAARLGVDHQTIHFHIQKGKLAAVRIGRYLLVDDASVQRAETEQDEEVLIMRSRVAHILGVNLPRVARYVERGKLQSKETVQKRNAITRESLEAFLLSRLSGITPYDWIETRLASTRPLLTVDQHARWADEFDLSQVAHITYPGRKTEPHLVLPESALSYLSSSESEVTQEQLIQFLGYQPRSLRGCIRDYPEFFECPLHDHDNTYRRSCALAMLNSLCVSGMTPLRWFQAVTEGDPIVTISYAQKKLRKKDQRIHQLVGLGRLPGLRKPKRGVIFLQSTVDYLSTPEGQKVLKGAV